MVTLSSRFNVLAVFGTLAALSLSPLSASAVAIQARDSTSYSKHVVARSPSRQQTFMLPLPSLAMKKSAAKKNKHESTSSTQGKQHKPAPRPAHVARHHRDGVERRSFVILPGGHGQSYVISPRSISPADGQAHIESEGQEVGDFGRVDVMSPTTEGFKKIASLWIAEGSIVKASDTNYTKLRMVRVAGSGAASESDEHLVRLLADGVTTDGVPYCITTNTQNGSSAMTAQECSDSEGNPAISQLFAHNDNTGVVRPMQSVGNDDTGTDGQHNSTADGASPGKGSVEAAQSVFGERDLGETNKAQNITLMFVPNTQVANIEDAPQVTVITATSTMTTTYTITTPMTASVSAADVAPTFTVTSSDSTGTSTLPAADASHTSSTPTVVSSSISAMTTASTVSAAALDPTSSLDSSSSFSSETPIVTVAAATTSSTSESVSSSSSAVSSVTSAPTLAALDVQVVAPVTSSSGSGSTMVTSTSTTPTSSVNAKEIASRIAASFASIADITSSTVMPMTTTSSMDTISSTTSSTTSASVPSLTPRSTAPYTWVFKVRKE